MQPKTVIKLVGAAFACILTFIVATNTFHKVDDTEWQAVQYLNGQVEIKENAGFYFAFFPKVTEYPRNFQIGFTERVSDECPTGGKSIRTTFNDGGNAEIDTLLRIATPTTTAQKREFHRQFNGNLDNVKSAVFAHLGNVLKDQCSAEEEAGGELVTIFEDGKMVKTYSLQEIRDRVNSGL